MLGAAFVLRRSLRAKPQAQTGAKYDKPKRKRLTVRRDNDIARYSESAFAASAEGVSLHLLEGVRMSLWMYELRRADRTLVDQRGAYRSEREARNAGERARLWIEEARYPREKLDVIVRPE